MTNAIDISKIQIKLGDKEPRDEKLINLFRDAYSGKLLVRLALINISAIRPFSEYKPTISTDFRRFFEDLERKKTPPPLHVYPDGEVFIMSDDYSSYCLYREKKYTKIMCILLGDSNSEEITEKSDPFQLPPPELQVQSESD